MLYSILKLFGGKLVKDYLKIKADTKKRTSDLKSASQS